MKSKQYPGYSGPHLFIVSASYVLLVGMVMKGWEILRNGAPWAHVVIAELMKTLAMSA